MPYLMALPNPLPSDRENALYDEWKNRSESERDTVEKQLLHSINLHAHRVLYMVMRSTSADVIDDITFSIFADIDSFRGDSKFSTWVHRAILNYCHNLQRTRRRKKETPLTHAHAKEIGVFHDPDKVLILEQLIQRLDDPEKEIIQLYLEGNSVPEIASILNITQANAAKRLTRGIRGLRETGKIYQ